MISSPTTHAIIGAATIATGAILSTVLPTKYMLAIGIGAGAAYLTALWLNSKKASISSISQQPIDINTTLVTSKVESTPVAITTTTQPEKKTVNLYPGLANQTFDAVIKSLKNTTDLTIEIEKDLAQEDLEKFLLALRPLKQLTQLTLSAKSDRTHTIRDFPDALRQLPQIESLSIEKLGSVVNQFPSDMSSIFPHLTTIAIIGSRLLPEHDGTFTLHPIWQLSSLKNLSLNNVNVPGLIRLHQIPDDIDLPNLEELTIDFSLDSFENLPENLGNCSKLRHLRIMSKTQMPVFPKNLLKLAQLEFFYIYTKKGIKGEAKKFLMDLIANNPKLKELDLDVKNQGELITNSPQLKELTLKARQQKQQRFKELNAPFTDNSSI